MPVQLIAQTDGPDIVLDKPILLLGRHAECDIQLNSRKISRRHCCIAQVNHYLVVRDLGSTNGIRVNGVRVLEGRLKAGDELTIGNFRYQISWDDKPSPLPVAPKASAVARPKTAPPVSREPVGALAASSENADEDALLESCDDPVLLGKPSKPNDDAGTPKLRSPDSGSLFPDDVNLRADSNQGLNSPANPPH